MHTSSRRPEGKVPVQLWIEPDLAKALKIQAIRDNMTISNLLADRVRDYLAEAGEQAA